MERSLLIRVVNLLKLIWSRVVRRGVVSSGRRSMVRVTLRTWRMMILIGDRVCRRRLVLIWFWRAITRRLAWMVSVRLRNSLLAHRAMSVEELVGMPFSLLTLLKCELFVTNRVLRLFMILRWSRLIGMNRLFGLWVLR